MIRMEHSFFFFFNHLLISYFVLCYSLFPVLSLPPLLGIHPLDEKYFASEIIECKDRSKSFPRDRLNDNFCDCADGTDEPGTSACPNAKFYCRNVGSRPQFLFSSHVNDRICDCCDGSDEYDHTVTCPNMCVMGGNVVYKADNYHSTSGSIDTKDTKIKVYSEDSVEKLKGLKIVIILQVILIILLVIFLISYRRFKSRRRHYR